MDGGWVQVCPSADTQSPRKGGPLQHKGGRRLASPGPPGERWWCVCICIISQYKFKVFSLIARMGSEGSDEGGNKMGPKVTLRNLLQSFHK